MARPLGIEFPGALYHMTSRGDGRADIYRGDSDRRMLLGLLADVCERFNWWGHAYCLMTNHYPLKAIGEFFGLHYARIGRIVRRVKEAKGKT